MDTSFSLPFEVFNGILLTIAALVPIVILVVSARPEWGASRVAQLSRRALLPLGSEATEGSIRARARTLTRVNMWVLLAAIAVVGTMFLLTPLGASPYFVWFLVVAILFGGLTVSATIVSTRERLFSPAPAAPRIARANSLTTADYIGLWRARLPAIILAGSGLLVAATAVAAALGAVAPWPLISVIATAAVAGVATVLGRWAERRVLAQPQPASDTVELAWDDLFRADALSNLRLGAAIVAWLPAALASAVLLRTLLSTAAPGWEGTVGLVPWWGIPVLQILYTLGQGRLQPSLYPAFLRRATTPGIA